MKWRNDDFVVLMQHKEILIHCLMDVGLIAKEHLCPMCGGEMNLRRCDDRSSGLKWECKRQENGKRHKADMSVRKGAGSRKVEWH